MSHALDWSDNVSKWCTGLSRFFVRLDYRSLGLQRDVEWNWQKTIPRKEPEAVSPIPPYSASSKYISPCQPAVIQHGRLAGVWYAHSCRPSACAGRTNGIMEGRCGRSSFFTTCCRHCPIKWHVILRVAITTNEWLTYLHVQRKPQFVHVRLLRVL